MIMMAVCSALCAADMDLKRQALDGALELAKAALPVAELQGKALAVLPFKDGSTGELTGKVKNLLTSAGLKCLEGKDDPMWDEIIKEIAWNERKEPMLDSTTLLKFGKLQSVQALAYGKVSALEGKDDRAYAEIELHITEIETRRHLWGGTYAKRVYAAGSLHGLVDLPQNMRELLKKSFEEAKASMQEAGAAARLANVKTVAVVPLAGDVDEYITGLAVEMLTKTAHTPRNLRIPSVSQLRMFVKDGMADVDAMLYGAIRDLSECVVETKLDTEKHKKITRSEVNVEVQLFVEDMKNGDILWSRTIAVSEPKEETVTLTEKEMNDERERLERERAAERERLERERAAELERLKREHAAEREWKKTHTQEKLEDIPEEIKAEVADNWKSILKKIGIGICFIIGIGVIVAIIKGILGNVFIR